MDFAFKIPVLLLTFNRPNHTRQIWEAVKLQKPSQLYVFQDGARDGNETDVEKCASVRAIFNESLDWECELHTNFSSVNLGCGRGPSTGISWFFEHVQRGVILEDDAVPAPDFFSYADELLERYETNEQIKVIGSMHLDGNQYGKGSYHFSMGNRNLCAWATWKRSWDLFDYQLKNITAKDLQRALKYYKATTKEINYWCDRLAEIHKDCLADSSWDMQFIMSIWLNKGIGIFPNVNLSTNIGFDEEGTHTTSSGSVAANYPVQSILPLIHPETIEVCRQADLNYHKLFFQPEAYGWQGIKNMPFRINKRVKNILGIKSWL